MLVEEQRDEQIDHQFTGSSRLTECERHLHHAVKLVYYDHATKCEVWSNNGGDLVIQMYLKFNTDLTCPSGKPRPFLLRDHLLLDNFLIMMCSC